MWHFYKMLLRILLLVLGCLWPAYGIDCGSGEAADLSGPTFQFYVDGNDPQDDDQDALNGALQFDKNSVLEVYRNNGVFRVFSLDFTIEFAVKVTVLFYNANWNVINSFETDLSPFQTRYCLYSANNPPNLPCIDIQFLPQNGQAGVKFMRFYFTLNPDLPSDVDLIVQVVQMNACIGGGGGFPGNAPTDFQSNNANKGAGFDIVAAFSKLCRRLFRRIRAPPQTVTAIRRQKAIIEPLVQEFERDSSNYIWENQPTSFLDQVAWLRAKSLEAGDVVFQIRKEVRTLLDLVLTSRMSRRSRIYGVYRIRKFDRRLDKAQKELLRTNLLFVESEDLGPVLPFRSPLCSNQSQCPPDTTCCQCRCRRPFQCFKIQAQETLSNCVGLTIDTPKGALKGALDGVCVLIDALKNYVNPSLGQYLDDQKRRIKAAIDTNPYDPLPGKPDLDGDLRDLAEWLIDTSRDLLGDSLDARDAMDNIQNRIVGLTPLRANTTALIDELMDLSVELQAVDRAVLQTTNCFITYGLTEFQAPIPQ